MKMRFHHKSKESLFRFYNKLKNDTQKLGLVEMSMSDIKPGMILYTKKARWSKSGYGWMYDLSFPKHHERYRVVKQSSTPFVTQVVIRKIGTKKVEEITSYYTQHVYVLDKSIKK